MQNLIATTFEVVHYIALQAVHYKPLQEVHLSRYNQKIAPYVTTLPVDWNNPVFYLNNSLTLERSLFNLDGWRCRLSTAFLASASELQMY